MVDIKLIGSRIKELRQKKGLTQNELASTLAVSFQAVSNWERGIAPPELENLIGIASFFGVLVDDLLCPPRDELYLGIDGGGTKTEFAVVSADGFVFKQFKCEGCNPNDVGFAKTSSIICDGIAETLIEFPSVKTVFAGIAGISAGNNTEHLLLDIKKRFPALKAKVSNDSLSLLAMEDSADMAVISGTGSVVFVKNGDSLVRLGGWGYLLDNAGSAYDIGRDALRATLEAEDLLKPATTLGKLLCKQLNTKTAWESIGAVYSGGKPFVASLAAAVFEAYAKGDATASEIVDRNAKALADLLNAGTRLYGAGEVAIASGGIFEHYPEIMISHIGKYSDVKIVISDLPPIYGACRKAVAVGAKEGEGFYGNFKKSYGGTKQ